MGDHQRNLRPPGREDDTVTDLNNVLINQSAPDVVKQAPITQCPHHRRNY
jgi:hypothetical protein